MDDFALFADNKALLWEWKIALTSRLAALRLTIHDHKAQVLPTVNGVPWLGLLQHGLHSRRPGHDRALRLQALIADSRSQTLIFPIHFFANAC